MRNMRAFMWALLKALRCISFILSTLLWRAVFSFSSSLGGR